MFYIMTPVWYDTLLHGGYIDQKKSNGSRPSDIVLPLKIADFQFIM